MFAGTPAAAVPVARRAAGVPARGGGGDHPAGRAAGRGLQDGAQPGGRAAAEAGLEVLKPRRPRDPEFLTRLRALAPDCCPVTAYGALIPQAGWPSPRTAG